MKKISCSVLLLLIANTALAGCELTTDMLKSGGDAGYDDYLYADTQQRELRNEGKPGYAYLCGAGFCTTGTKKRLRNAAVGNAGIQNDAVYECINTSDSGRTSYRWVQHNIQEKCVVESILMGAHAADVDGGADLYRVGNQYCKNITTANNVTVNQKTNFWDTANTFLSESGKNFRSATSSTINGGVEIIVNFSDNITERFRIMKDGTVSIVDSAGKTFVGTLQTMTDGTVRIFDSAGKTFVGALKIAKDGTVQVLGIGGRVLQTLSDNTTRGYIATLDFIKTGFTEAGKTIRAVSGDVRDVTVAGINGGTEIIVNFSDNITERFRIMANGTVSIIDSAGKTFVGTLQTMTDGTVRIFDSAGKTLLGALKIAQDGTVQILNIWGDVIKSISQNMTDAYKSTLQFFGNRLDSFDENVRTVITSAANTVGMVIQVAGDVATTAMNNATDFAKHFTTEIVSGVQALQINRHRLSNLEKRIAQCTTQEQVAEIVNQALKDAELSDTQCRQVQAMISQYDAKLTVITGSIGILAMELAAQKQLIQETARQIEELGGKYTSLAAQVRTKVNAKQVIELIGQYTQTFSDGQTRQLYEILDEYTKKLSDGQRAEVAGLIAQYVDPKFERVNARIDLEAKRRIATDKITSAMSVLNAFATGADVSVWKNQDGKFNTARLASDATAGVVLGTVGGLLSNKIVKKNQIKKGFDDVKCSVGGQTVADWADEFTVGMQ
ncbi:MAG: hypothetical protein E7007_02580 [Alphaproteobacteria bacterium]|nr:hypothetical protein [Alphaproteobacteria bacterium]